MPSERPNWERFGLVDRTDNLDGLLLLLHALEQEGRTPTVVARSEYNRARASGAWPTAAEYDYLVVEDDTWRAWQNAQGYP